MAELLLELLSEEIPAGLQVPAADQLQRHVVEALKAAEIEFADAASHSAPRRIALIVTGLPTVQADRTIERKGPRTSAPDQAIQGFLGAAGVTLDDCEVREDKKGTYYVAVLEQTGQPVKDVLADIVRDAVSKFSWPKSMRWADTRFRWVRPLHNVLAVFDGEPLAGGIDLEFGELPFAAQTFGHRFMAPGAISVGDSDTYVAKLEQAFVVVDRSVRRAKIAETLKELSQALGLSVRDDPALLDEVTGLVEWPVVLIGDIDPQFMELPAEVLTASMRNHQKYFALENPDGTLASKFAFVANMVAEDEGAQIIAGNQRVLRARLADAQHFWDQDRKVRLEDRVPALEQIVFHAKLGTLGAKIQRIQALAGDLADNIQGADRDRVRSAAMLAKADLVTGMVGEFPELQGTMGRYYALAEGEAADVADAIAEHYSPAGPTDMCPSSPTSIAVALADKIDTLVGFWSIDEKPTGSKDPYALRRAALGVIRIILENRLRLPLKTAFATGGDLNGNSDDSIYADLVAFIADRLKVHLRDEGISHDRIAATFEQSGDDDLVRLLERVRALAAFLDSEDGANLLIAYRRAANIVRAEQKKDDEVYAGAAYDASLAAGPDDGVEAALWDVLSGLEGTTKSLLESEDFADAMSSLAALRVPVDKFFDDVTVNVDDPDIRRNRLRLLAHIQQVMDNVADFSKIEG